MNVHRKRHPGAILLIILVLGALFGACSAEHPTGATTNTKPGVNTAGSPAAGLNTCMSCHSVQTADWLATRHANVNSSPSYTTSTYCASCHDKQGDSQFLSPARMVVSCEACHGGGSLHVDAGGIGPIGFAAASPATVSGPSGTILQSAQFNTCTTCHELLLASDPAGTTPATPVHSAAIGTAPTGSQYVITETHFAKPATFSASGTNNSPNINGYAMDYSSTTVCTNCHAPHGTADINRDWAQSAHANRTVPGAWSHYNMSCDGTLRLTCGPSSTYPPDAAHPVNDRRLCQRCHTTTGFVAFADALASGDTVLSNGLESGTVSKFTFSTTYYPQMLQCLSCHTDNKGKMRNPGAFTASHFYRVTNVGAPSGTMAGIQSKGTFIYPDLGSSNVCVLCHTGRTNGRSVHNLNTDPTYTTVNFSNLKATDSHDFPAAATMFKGLGYEYTGRNYTNPSSYRHDQIGTPSVPNTGTSGPCVGCHMYQAGAPARHLFTVVSTSGIGTAMIITNVMSEVCYNCHAGSSTALAGVLNDESAKFADGMSALKYMLSTGGVYTPLSSGTTNWLSPGDTDTTGNMTGKNNLGAVFNSRALGLEGGAYIHNSKYVKRLLYDSIDWLDDGQLNFSTGSTLSTACTGTTAAWCGGALNYILPNGVVPLAPAERP